MKYLHIGGNEVISCDEIVGIFDLDSCTTDKKSVEFLSLCEKRGQVKSISNEIPRTFVLCVKNSKKKHKKTKEKTVYLTQISSIALRERLKNGIL